MGDTFDVSAEGLQGLLEGITAVEAEIGSDAGLNRIATAVGALLLNRIRTRFLDETDPDGNKWIPSKAGLKRRARGSTGTLFATGALFHSIQLARAQGGEVGIGTNRPYAAKHQLGEGQVQRVFLGFGEDDVRLSEDFVAKRIDQIIERNIKKRSSS